MHIFILIKKTHVEFRTSTGSRGSNPILEGDAYECVADILRSHAVFAGNKPVTLEIHHG